MNAATTTSGDTRAHTTPPTFWRKRGAEIAIEQPPRQLAGFDQFGKHLPPAARIPDGLGSASRHAHLRPSPEGRIGRVRVHGSRSLPKTVSWSVVLARHRNFNGPAQPRHGSILTALACETPFVVVRVSRHSTRHRSPSEFLPDDVRGMLRGTIAHIFRSVGHEDRPGNRSTHVASMAGEG